MNATYVSHQIIQGKMNAQIVLPWAIWGKINAPFVFPSIICGSVGDERAIPCPSISWGMERIPIDETPWARCLQGAGDARWVAVAVVVVVCCVVVAFPKGAQNGVGPNETRMVSKGIE